MYKEDLEFNNLQWLMYHKTQPNQAYTILFLACFSHQLSSLALTEVWVTVSLLKSPGLHSVFLFFSTMLLSGRSRFFLLFLVLPSLWWPLQVYQLHMVSLSLSRSTIFCPLARSLLLSIFSLSCIFTLWSAGTEKSSGQQILLFISFLFFK